MIESKGRQLAKQSPISKIAMYHCLTKGLFFKGASENIKTKVLLKCMILMDLFSSLYVLYSELKIGVMNSIPLFNQYLLLES